MQSPGTYISGIGHATLVGLFIVGWGFDSEPLVFDDISVSVISGEEFEQMRAASTPEPGTAEPTQIVQPVIDPTPPPTPAEEEPTETAPPPEPVAPPEAEAPPPPPPPPPPPLETEVTDAPPVEPAPPAAPPPTPDVEVSETPTPPQADRIASTPSAPPPPDAQVDEIVREEVTPDESTEPEVVAEEQDPTAPEEAATEIGIADLAPTTSVRPQVRPNRPTPPAAEPEVETAAAPTEVETPSSQEDVTAALAAALAAEESAAAAEAPAVAAGPPMTGAERDSFRIAVNGCWNVDPGSVAARVTVEVGFSLDREGKVMGSEVRLLSSDGDQSATNTAFEAARRAILRCQSGGYQLPADKYDQWKDVVITFDPSGMRLR